jgi:protease-4
MVRTWIGAVLLAAVIPLVGFGQGGGVHIPDYAVESRFMAGTPGAVGGAAGAYFNPAVWAMMKRGELAFAWNDRSLRERYLDNWGLFLGGHGIGFSMRHSNDTSSVSPSGMAGITDYQFALASGDGETSFGIAYTFSRGDETQDRRDNLLTAGALWRPCRHASLGAAATFALSHSERRAIADLGLRPFGTPFVTLFGDVSFNELDQRDDVDWGIGIEMEPLAGIRLAFKTEEVNELGDRTRSYSLRFGLTLQRLGFHVIPHYDEDNERTATSYLVRYGPLVSGLPTEPFFRPRSTFVKMNMKGKLAYQKAKYLDERKHALIDLLQQIEEAKNDPQIGGIALNLAGFSSGWGWISGPELIWELREKLIDFKESGKKVIVYFERGGMWEYYLASVGDKIWMDPVGLLMLPGFNMGRTFWRHFFDKIGIGVDEWRYFKYKSAFESISREKFSEADREQRDELIGDTYEEYAKDIMASRAMTRAKFDSLINHEVLFLPDEAAKFGLVDTVARWDKAKDFAEEVTGKKGVHFASYASLSEKRAIRDEWGEPPRIALVYALGSCDLETGIRGRYTSRVLSKLAKDKRVEAVVLRADSPGGDALPSDLVDAQVKEVSEEKPIIVTQGNVAASGGYWISMSADEILVSPYTITASIGVIGGWLYNDGFGDKIGFTYDNVYRGDHGDLGHGIHLPFINVELPERALNDEEHGRIRSFFMKFYRMFLKKVAEERELEVSYVDSVGQGRVYLGRRGLELKLVDRIGGLEDALNLARERAGISPKRHVEIVEYPKRKLINFDALFKKSGPLGWLAKETVEDKTDYELDYLRRISNQPGAPIPMIPPEYLFLE